MKFAIWFWVVFLILAAGLTYYFFGDLLKEQRRVSSRYGIRADHLPFEFAETMDRCESLFRVDWPPKDPADARRLRTPPLLNGRLAVSGGQHDGETTLNIRVVLTRADSESGRERWNRQLAFPEYDWMSRVRVWDDHRKWLWPNLPYLLRAHGIEREQRYGGVDPGKGVDNDFAALVIKPVGSAEVDTDLITAEWFGRAGGAVDKRSIVHEAFSDDLQWAIPVDGDLAAQSGVVGVWLIYADFLESRAPDSWPDTPEFNGGVLAYFSIHWRLDGDGRVAIVKTVNEIPPAATGVDWPNWLAAIDQSNSGRADSKVKESSGR